MASADLDLLELHSGDRLTQAEFHRIYERMPPHFKAELIGGIVYVASPLKIGHARNHFPLGSVLFAYESATPGVEAGDNATIILGEDSEPQPDAYLRILPEFGGQTRTVDDYVVGGPELLAEIAVSSHLIDLHAKKRDYQRYGVLEYLELSVRDQQLHWFDLRHDTELAPAADGVLRSRYFPGLWLHAEALLARDARRLLACLDQGLASPEHADFVRRLRA